MFVGNKELDAISSRWQVRVCVCARVRVCACVRALFCACERARSLVRVSVGGGEVLALARRITTSGRFDH